MGCLRDKRQATVACFGTGPDGTLAWLTWRDDGGVDVGWDCVLHWSKQVALVWNVLSIWSGMKEIVHGAPPCGRIQPCPWATSPRSTLIYFFCFLFYCVCVCVFYDKGSKTSLRCVLWGTLWNRLVTHSNRKENLIVRLITSSVSLLLGLVVFLLVCLVVSSTKGTIFWGWQWRLLNVTRGQGSLMVGVPVVALVPNARGCDVVLFWTAQSRRHCHFKHAFVTEEMVVVIREDARCKAFPNKSFWQVYWWGYPGIENLYGT